MTEDKPVMAMMVGLPASGKSTYAKNLCLTNGSETYYPTIHSSDALREELFGDINDQSHNDIIFQELLKRINEDLSDGKSVIYDTCNISKKRRIKFLNNLKGINCYKICLCMATPYERCLANNESRKRKIPREAIERMYKNWCPPSLNEGFDNVKITFLYYDEHYKICNFFCGNINADSIDQENEHHTLTIGKHCKAAAEYIINNYRIDLESEHDVCLVLAALLHDNGKVFTKIKIDKDDNCHYYQHHCVGSYDAMFYLYNFSLFEYSKKYIELISYICNLIYYHMHPLNEWKQSDKCRERDRKLLGEEMYQDIMKLHEADLEAH